MALTEYYSNTGTVSTTELSLLTNATYSSASPQTADGVYYVMLDINAVTYGDQFEVKMYEKVTAAGTQRLVETWIFDGAQQSTVWTVFTPPLMHGWDITVKKIAGVDRSMSWSIRQAA